MSQKNKVGEILKENGRLEHFYKKQTIEVKKDDMQTYKPYSFYKLKTMK